MNEVQQNRKPVRIGILSKVTLTDNVESLQYLTDHGSDFFITPFYNPKSEPRLVN